MATKTINLTGAEVAVTGLDGANAHIRNDGTDVIYAAKAAGISAGADGVLGIPAGQAATVYGISGTVYMLGTGSAQIISNDYSELPFKTSATSGGSGADEIARAAINAHSGNAEIHVTADEKASWNGKAEFSDIPTTLPANGGNADTVDDKHASDFAQMRGNIADCDDAIAFGTYNVIPETKNAPTANYYHLVVEPAANGTWIKQTAVLCDATVPLINSFTRININGEWSEWTSSCVNADTLDGKHADDFALAENNFLDDFFSSKSGDIRALVIDLPSGGFGGNTDRLPNITGFPITGDIIITWSKSVYSNGFRYGTLQVRSMTKGNLPVYQCSVYNDGVYTDWQKLCDGGNAASVGAYTEAKLAELEARIAALEGGTT